MINYSGTFCALKLGADNITNFDVFLQGEYTVDNLRFTGGASAVYGIFINEFVIEPRIRNCTFEDYGNVDSWDIYASWQCWNLIISNCRKFTHSSTVAVGSFIAVPGQNKAATQYDGGNSRVSIEDCWMTCYNGLALGAFALVNATKSRIIGGGFQMSSGGILLGGHASGTLIDGVYSELSTAHNPFYVQAFSIVNSSGNYSPQQVIIQNGYINMHQEDIGSSGRMIHAGDSSVLISDWTVENMSISNFANGQSLVDQINVAGQKGNQYRSIKPLFVPASADNGARFVIRNGLSLAEPWNSLDISHGKWTPSVGGTATYGARTGTWHKVGEQVTCTFDVPITTLGTGSATQIFGLPFPALSSSGGNIGYFVSLATNVTSLYCRVDSGASAIILTGLPAAGNTVPGTLAVLGDSSRIIGSITYTVADLT
ncbi:hypothetical protein C7830_00370 [Pandoraea apista]|nr:hypothetical protein C7830_00370 [Pandoraea apista]